MHAYNYIIGKLFKRIKQMDAFRHVFGRNAINNFCIYKFKTKYITYNIFNTNIYGGTATLTFQNAF